MKIILSVLLLFWGTTVAEACTFDLECGVGKSCVKDAIGFDGYCVSGSRYQNDEGNDEYRYSPFSTTEGKSCRITANCTLGEECIQLYGC